MILNSIFQHNICFKNLKMIFFFKNISTPSTSCHVHQNRCNKIILASASTRFLCGFWLRRDKIDLIQRCKRENDSRFVGTRCLCVTEFNSEICFCELFEHSSTGNQNIIHKYRNTRPPQHCQSCLMLGYKPPLALTL